MKFFAFLLVFYVVTLTVLPCLDETGDRHDLPKKEIVDDASNGGHQDADHCSPFCTCCCCVSPMIPVIFDIQQDAAFRGKICFLDNPSDYGLCLFVSIWQPPRTGFVFVV